MKLGEMPKRYDKAPTLIPRGMVTIGECGKYVLWADYCMLKAKLSDAQAKSLADERRIQELVEALQFAEAAIEAAREVYRIKGDLRGYELMGIALSKARAALRVETQEAGR